MASTRATFFLRLLSAVPFTIEEWTGVWLFSEDYAYRVFGWLLAMNAFTVWFLLLEARTERRMVLRRLLCCMGSDLSLDAARFPRLSSAGGLWLAIHNTTQSPSFGGGDLSGAIHVAICWLPGGRYPIVMLPREFLTSPCRRRAKTHAPDGGR
jgi:hypothetical protein